MTASAATRFSVRDMTICSIFAAITAILTQITIPLPAIPVPISLGNFAVMLCAAVLPLKLAFASQLTYLLIGAFGAPVFTYFSGGFHKLAGPTGGYLIGYLALTLVVGTLKKRFPSAGLAGMSLIMLAGMLTCLAFGTVWLAIGLGYPLWQAFLTGTAPFLALDAVKALCAAAMGIRLQAALVVARK